MVLFYPMKCLEEVFSRKHSYQGTGEAPECLLTLCLGASYTSRCVGPSLVRVGYACEMFTFFVFNYNRRKCTFEWEVKTDGQRSLT